MINVHEIEKISMNCSMTEFVGTTVLDTIGHNPESIYSTVTLPNPSAFEQVKPTSYCGILLYIFLS